MNNYQKMRNYEDKICKLEILKNCIDMSPNISAQVVYDRYLEIIETTPIVVIDTTSITEVEARLKEHIAKYKSEKYRLMVKQSKEDFWEGVEELAYLSQRIRSYCGL